MTTAQNKPTPALDVGIAAQIDDLARSGGVSQLIGLLGYPDWAARRIVVSALAEIGGPAVGWLRDMLVGPREDEDLLAAAVEALVASRGDADEAVLDLLHSGDPSVICDAVQVLGRRRYARAIPLLGKLVRHTNDNVSVAAIEALGRIGGLGSVEPLLAAIDTKSFFRTFPAIDALGRTGDPRAVPVLVSLLRDGSYAGEAARALGATGSEAAVAPLGGLLARAGDPLTRTVACALADLRARHEARFGETASMARALPESVSPGAASARLALAAAGAGPAELSAIADVLGWLGDDGAQEQLVRMLEADGVVARAATAALRRLGPPASELLLKALRTTDSAHRGRLLPLIGYGTGTVENVVACLDDLDPTVQALACDALARLGNTSAVPALFRLVGSADARLSQAAAAAIHSLGSVETRQRALQMARGVDPRARRAALRILSYFGYPEALEVLLEALHDPDDRIREVAILGLPLIEHPGAVDALLVVAAHTSASTRAVAVRALGDAPSDPRALQLLRAALDDADPWVRYYACRSLGRLRAHDAADLIILRVRDEAGQVRVSAVEALAHLRSAAARLALQDAAMSEDPDMRRAAIVALGIVRDVASIPMLSAAAEAPDPATRLMAISAVAEFDTLDVVPVLARAASDPTQDVASAAVGFLATRAGDAATRALIEQLARPEARPRVLAALAVAPEERIDGVLVALSDAGPELASLLIAALVRMRRSASDAAIASVLSFENVHARRAAASALSALGTAEAHGALARAHLHNDPDEDVRRLGRVVKRE